MKGQKKQTKEIEEIKIKLIDVSLITASIIGLPLLTLVTFRDISSNIKVFWYFYLIIYFYILIFTLFRGKIKYSIKATTLVISITFIGILDLLKIGFDGISILWFTSAILVTSIYFNIKKSLITLLFSIVVIIATYILHKNNLIEFYNLFENEQTHTTNILVFILNMVLLGLLISFSHQLINKNLVLKNIELKTKTENLEKVTSELKNEVETRRKSEMLAIDSEKKFRNIFDKSLDAILIIRDDGSILDFNDAFITMSGYNEKEIWTLKYFQFLPDDEKSKININFKDLNNFPPRFELKYKSKTGELRFIDCSSSIINYNENQVILLMIRDYTEKINQEKENYLSVISAEEKERSRFSRELHDGLGPLLSTLKLYLEVYFSNPGDIEIKERIENVLNESIKSVKEISNNLSPHTLENFGLTKAISSFIEKVKFSKKINVNFNSNFDLRLKPEVEISLYRYVTELINNTIKHAKSSLINIEIEKVNDMLIIKYHDDGVGFNLNDPNIYSKGIGLLNLKSRIEKIGGSIEFITSPGNGFNATASLTFN